MLRPTYRHVFAVLAAVVSIYFGLRTSRAVVDNRALADQVQHNRALTTTLAVQNSALQAEIAYEKTPAYVQLAAREQLGLMKPGDHVVQLKMAAASAQAAPAPTPAASLKAAPAAQPASTPNWRRWLDLLAHPQPEPSLAP